MNTSRTTLAAFLAAILGTAILVGRPAISLRANAAGFPSDDATVRHVLNRVAFGPRPGDVERVQKMGLGAYIDGQLHPERIPDSTAEARLASFTTVKLTSGEIADRFERPLLEMRRSMKQQAGGDGGDQEAMRARPEVRQAQQQANSVLVELGEQKVLRAVYSERQLQEVLVDFWFNHFNVDARKGRDRFMLTEYEREAIRPHVLGKFRDLLEATAKSPAMLLYLDNWLSVDPNGLHTGGNARAQFPRARFGRPGRFPAPILPPVRPQQAALPPKAPRGLNENYGRELMELHTLGVDGGYTQKDVTEVARAFTGWTIEPPRQGGAAFRFEPRMHDEGEKHVLGHRINVGGMADGEQVLDILARHPSTARFVSTKLARRFVGDTPPPALVDRMAARFRETDGDLREVMRTLLTSPEFIDPKFRDAKVKTPLEFVVSAVRALGIDVADGRQIVGAVQQLGMPLYQCQPPTGYKDTGDAWATSGALVNRMNVALNLGGRPIPGIPAAADPWSEADHDAFIRGTLGTDVSAATREAISKATSTPQVVALTLGSPEFQRH